MQRDDIGCWSFDIALIAIKRERSYWHLANWSSIIKVSWKFNIDSEVLDSLPNNQSSVFIINPRVI